MSPKRIAALIVVLFVMGGGLTARLFSISVLQNKDFVSLAKQQQNVVRDVLPRRGDIFIQNTATGKPSIVAQSVERFAVSATPRNVKKKAEYAKLLASLTGADEKELLEKFEANGLYMNPLKHGLTQEEVLNIANKLNEVEGTQLKVNFDTTQGNIIYFAGGVFFVREYERVYPEGGLLGQLLGFVNDHGTGQYGFEGQYDGQLKGYSGRILAEQDSLGTLLDQTAAVQGKDGTNYELSIDRNVQFVVERELAQTVKDSEAEGGSVVIMDPKTGEIIAMASTPSYNPNEFREVAKDKEKISLFDNPVVSKVWEPGSIFKPLIMSAAMDMGLVTPDTKEDFPGSVTVQGYKIETALRKAYGVETMTQVLANSDNVAMVWVANKLGNQKMYDYLKKYGFGQHTGIDLKSEVSGNVLPANRWQDINRATISFGQGIAVTPLQVVAAYSAIANNGKLVRPRVVHSVIHADGTRQDIPVQEGEQVISPDTAKKLRDMMVATVVYAHNRAGTEGYKVGGKTGTAQIPDPKGGGYIEDAYNHSFVGMGPSDNPRYVMLVKVDRPNIQKVGLFAEGTAVPLFGKISTFLLNYYQVPPTNR